MRHIGDAERRARLVRRHGLGSGFGSLAEASAAMLAWHATEAATVHLAAWARVPGLAVADVDAALYDARTLVKQLAMRRTLFAFPRDVLPAVWGSAAARVADEQRRRMVRDVEKAGLADDGAAWVARACAAVLERLGEPTTTARLREEVPELAGRITVGAPGKKWGGEVPIAPRVLTLLGAEGRIVRAGNAGHWRLNKPTWVRTECWLDDTAPLPEADGYAVLVARWLRTFGPGTEDDLVWWLGSTRAAVRRALAEVGAVPVSLDAGTGYVLPDDVEPVAPAEPVAALLPTLDPTVMGWKQRDFYLAGEDRPLLFDRNGNAGNTAWWDGRVGGAWVQDEAGVVRVLPCHELPGAAAEALGHEAERLTAWLDGVRVVNVYASPLMRAAPLS